VKRRACYQGCAIRVGAAQRSITSCSSALPCSGRIQLPQLAYAGLRLIIRLVQLTPSKEADDGNGKGFEEDLALRPR
jgi:hypothetical protein